MANTIEHNIIGPIKCETGLVFEASGSAYLENAGTKIICSIFGPRASQKSGTFNEVGVIDCDVRVSNSVGRNGENYEKNLSELISSALENVIILEKYAKTTISIALVILEQNGDILSSAINCAIIALANASIEIVDMATACTVAEVEGQLILNPSGEQLKKSTSYCTVATLSSHDDKICQLNFQGKINALKLKDMIGLCVLGNRELRVVLREILFKS